MFTAAGQTEVSQLRPHDWCGSRPRLHSEQKDQKCTVGTVQLHPGSVLKYSSCLFFSLSLQSLCCCPSRYWFLLSSLFVKVVGEKEKTSNTVNVRTRDNKIHGERTVEECIERLKQLKSTRSQNAEEEFWGLRNVLLGHVVKGFFSMSGDTTGC